MNKEDYFSGEEYQKKLKQEAAFWGDVYEEKLKQGVLKPVIKKVLSFVGLHGSFSSVDFRNELTFKAQKVIWGRKELETIFKIASQGKRVLEIGCGTGWLSIEIARRNKDIEIDAIDIAESAIKRGNAFYNYLSKKENLGNINFIVRDLNKIKLEENRYDVVVAFATLHHIINLGKLLGEVKKSLKPNGFFLAYEDNGLCERDKKKLAIMLFPFLILKEIVTKKRIIKQVEDMYEWSVLRQSPFEGVHKGVSISSEIEKNFTIKRKKMLRCFIDGVIRNTSLPVMRLFATPLKIIDDLILKLGILNEGRSIFIIAENEK